MSEPIGRSGDSEPAGGAPLTGWVIGLGEMLDVRGEAQVIAAIERCWASASSARVRPTAPIAG